MIFETENDMRRWVRLQERPKFRWVEPARGATLGTPDCWCLLPQLLWPFAAPEVVWIELKLAERDPDTGMIRIKVRPEQKKTIGEIANEGGTVFLLAGEKGGDWLWLLHADLVWHEGWIDLKIVIANELCWPVANTTTGLETALRMAVSGSSVPNAGVAVK